MGRLSKVICFSILLCSTSTATVIACETGQVVVWDPTFNETLANVQGYVFQNMQGVTNTPAVDGQTGNYCPGAFPRHGAPYVPGNLTMWRASADWQHPGAPQGGAFTLNAFDLAKQFNYDDYFGLPNTFTVFMSGYQTNGNVLQRTITFAGGDPVFKHFAFTGWTDLTLLDLESYIVFGAGEAYTALLAADNIDVTETPEPVAILLMGVGSLLWWRARKWWCARHDSNMRPFGS